MHGRFMRLLGAIAVVGAMLAFTTAPVGAQELDEEAASEEVVDNLIRLFDLLAIAGNPDTDPAEAEAAIEEAAGLIEGGDSEEVKAQIPGIAALASAAELTIEIDEPPTFDESGTTATYVFSALSFGNPSQVDEANGIHVLEDGTWKLSSQLWNAFVALGGDSTPEDVDDGGEGEGDEAEGEGEGEDEELANTGSTSDILAILAVAVLGAGAMFVSGSRRIRLTD